jgi:gentisate 1,2-dioxygenase
MKINIDDEHGSSLISVLSLDGEKAVEGKDFVVWEGTYHKNGQYSYQEGGVALKNGIVLINKKSTHYHLNNNRYFMVIVDNIQISQAKIMGAITEQEQRPKNCSQVSKISDEIFEKVLSVTIEYLRKRSSKTEENIVKMLEKWDEMSRFV